MILQAIVVKVRPGNLLVFDESMSQTVLVHTPRACRFRVGNCVSILYNGIMTRSIPPQITAIKITRIRCSW